MGESFFKFHKQKLLQSLAGLLMRSGLFRFFLSIADRWEIGKKSAQSRCSPFLKRHKYSKFQILFYHHVGDENGSIFGGIPVKIFRRQMEILANYFNVLPLEELVERALNGDLPPRAFAITFDDGYQDNYVNAFPALKDLDLPATIFLATGAIESYAQLWHDRIFDAFHRTEVNSLFLCGKEYSLTTPAEKSAARTACLWDLRSKTPQERDEVIEQIIAKLEVHGYNSAKLNKLTWQEIEEMSKAKITFGAHTVTHPILSLMPAEEARKEIVASKEAIERRLKSPVRLFAYPSGRNIDFNDNLKQVLKDAGFLCAVTILHGTNYVYTDPYELRRLQAWDLNPQTFALRLGWHRLSGEG